MSLEKLLGDRREREDVFTEAADRLNLLPIAVEKDFWVCWTLMKLVQLDGVPAVTFKGGTSLSKVHGLIDRFSEDIDLTYSRDGWNLDDPTEDGLSGKMRRRRLDALSERAAAITKDLRDQFTAMCVDSGLIGEWSVELDKQDELRLLFHYPPGVQSTDYLKPVVIMEFGARGDPWPVATGLVTSMVDEAVPEYEAGVGAEVQTLQPERTFWEKATAIHALHHQTLAKPQKRVARQSRHLYDLHRMWDDGGVRHRIMEHPGLYDAVVRHKTVFFYAAAARYDLAEAHELAVVPHEQFEKCLRTDYGEMRDMFPADPPPFDDLLSTLGAIRDTVAGWPRCTDARPVARPSHG